MIATGCKPSVLRKLNRPTTRPLTINNNYFVQIICMQVAHALCVQVEIVHTSTYGKPCQKHYGLIYLDPIREKYIFHLVRNYLSQKLKLLGKGNIMNISPENQALIACYEPSLPKA